MHCARSSPTKRAALAFDKAHQTKARSRRSKRAAKLARTRQAEAELPPPESIPLTDGEIAECAAIAFEHNSAFYSTSVTLQDCSLESFLCDEPNTDWLDTAMPQAIASGRVQAYLHESRSITTNRAPSSSSTGAKE